MRSFLAVGAQLVNSVCNYAVYIIFSRFLHQHEFVDFSTAVGVSMFAYAFAEGGVSYVAPKEIGALDAESASRRATAFLIMSICIYVFALAIGFLFWNCRRQRSPAAVVNCKPPKISPKPD